MTAARLVVIGDTLLDSDIDGSVTRIAPDAPAPVLDEITTAQRPGGAGLAALLATGQGYEVVLITALAHDAGGARLAELMARAGVTVHGLTCEGGTAEKVRLRADGRVLLRLDRGGTGGAVPGEPSDAALAEMASAAAILVSDYGRGVARQPVLRAALADSSAPVVWDPHPRGPAAVPGARLITPNEAELRGLTAFQTSTGGAPDRRGPRPGVITPGASGAAPSGPVGGRLAAVAQGAEQLRRRWRAGAVAVTLGADGALFSHAAPAPLVVPVPAPASGDTCGAGDQFAVAAAVALAGGALVSEAVQDAVTSAAAYVAAGGVGTIVEGFRGMPEPAAPARAAPAVPAPAPVGSATAATARRSSVPHHGGRTQTNGRKPNGTAAKSTGANGRAARSTAAKSTGADGTLAVRGPAEPGALWPGAGAAGALAASVRARGGTVVGSGGCFDLLHAGHVATLEAARRLGDCLIVCLNADSSVRALKGPGRPVVGQTDRARLLNALSCVDAVVVFHETTPHAVLSWLRPDVWVKGGDYSGGAEDQPDLPEADLVAGRGGQTVVVPYLDGRSTTHMITAARSSCGQQRGVEVG